MGLPPTSSSSSSQLPQRHPSPPPSLLPNLLSAAAGDWFLNASDRDTQILTQALTRELSSCSRGATPTSSSLFPSATPASCSSSLSLYENFSRCLEERPLQSQSFEPLRALQQQQQQQQRQQQEQQQQNQLQHQHQQKLAAMSSMWSCGDGSSHLEQYVLQKGSPLSSNCSPPLSASVETPASPFSTSTLSTNSAMSNIATDGFLAHSKPNNPQHHDSQNGPFARTMASSLKPPEVCSVYSDSSLSSSKPASIALSAQASVGSGGSKVNKRRSRVSSKAPIAVLSADTSNFRAMVQQLTGIPSSSSIHPFTHSGIPLLKPQPIRHSFTNNTVNLPTLDTSACFLGPRSMKEGFSFAQNQHQLSSSRITNLSPSSAVDLARQHRGCNVDNTALQSYMPSHVKQSVCKDQAISSSEPCLWDAADSLKVRGNFPCLQESEQTSAKQNAGVPAAALDSLLMEEHLAPKSSPIAVNSWLSFLDGAHANHASNMEIARMA